MAVTSVLIVICLFAALSHIEYHNVRAQPPSSGDWVVTSDEKYAGETFVVNGSIIVEAELNLIDCRVILNPPNDNDYNITVRDAGALILSNTVIETTGKTFSFTVQGRLIIDGASISNIHYGINVETGREVSINHLNITPAISATVIPTYAIRIQDTSNVFINDTHITGPFEYGVVIWWSGFNGKPSHVTIANTTINPVVSDSVYPHTGGILIRHYYDINISNMYINACRPISPTLDLEEFGAFRLENVSTPNGSVLLVTENNTSISGGSYGELIVLASGVSIDNSRINYLHVMYSKDLVVTDSVIGCGGIYVKDSVKISLYDDRVYRDVHIDYSINISIRRTVITGFDFGIYSYDSSGLLLEKNNISAHIDLPIYIYQSDNITIIGNRIEHESSGYCLKIYNPNGESNILVYLNAFIGEGAQDNLALYYDNGTYGNYWSAYTTGRDNDGNGIYDQPYSIDPDSSDRYPLTLDKWKDLIGTIWPPDTMGPQIVSIHYDSSPVAGSDVEVAVNVTDASGVREVILSYRVVGQGAWINVTMTYNGTFWIGLIPGQNANVEVEFKIYACDNNDNWSVSTTYTLTFRESGASITPPENPLLPLGMIALYIIIGIIGIIVILIVVKYARRK